MSFKLNADLVNLRLACANFQVFVSKVESRKSETPDLKNHLASFEKVFQTKWKAANVKYVKYC
jgi:hypothetical protein